MDLSKLTFVVNKDTSMTKARVNIRSTVINASIREETRNGRKVMIVPSATLPDDIVMNNIKYPADEIRKSYKTLNRTPAPYGHPMIGNDFVSARDPEGLNIGYIGAWNENARQENGRVFLDKVIDIEVASRSEDGKKVLQAINQGDPIHTSTGLICDLDPAEKDSDHKWVARNMLFDHDAILINEEGAATPSQGVGMLVNGQHQDVMVVNSAIEIADRELDWATMAVVRALEEHNRASFADRIKSALAGLFGSERDSQTNGKEDDMAVSDEQFKQLSEKVDTLSAGVGNIGETIANAVTEAMKPVKEHMDKIEANQKAELETKRTEAINSLVKSGQWEEDELKDMPLTALNKLVTKVKPGKAAALNAGGFNASGDKPFGDFSDYDPNASIDGDKKADA